MSRNTPITPFEVESKLLQLMDSLESETEAFEVLSVDSAKKSARYKASWARAYIRVSSGGKGSIKDRESLADYENEELHFDHLVAEALTKSKQQKLTSLRTEMDALRTISANVRAQT